jgi:DNA-binding GntR family transcriptional regulator
MRTTRAETEGAGHARQLVSEDNLAPLLHTAPIERTRLTQAVYELLRDKIMARELLPGQRIDIPMLARRLGVSRTPVKEAVNRLAAEGAIEILPQHGTFVASIDWPTLLELHDMRVMIETYVCDSLAYPLADELLAELRRLQGEMERLTDGDRFVDFPAHLETDRLFHTAIVRLAGNSRLTQTYEQINLPLRLARAYPDTNALSGALATREEHLAILDALAAGDAPRAREATVRHLQNALARHMGRLGVTPTDEWLARRRLP